MNSKPPSAIRFSTGARPYFSNQDYVPDHALCHINSGEMRVLEANQEHTFGAGETFLVKRNALVKCAKQPQKSDVGFEFIFLVLPKDFLAHYAIQHPWSSSETENLIAQQHVRLLAQTPALQSLFQSLVPYMQAHVLPSNELAELKLTEAILCLLEQNYQLGRWLFTDSEPDKLDLAIFMERNYRFNVPMGKFAELTGRSLSTFQRDFVKRFGMPATTWLLQRRLSAAHAALLQQKKPSDVYLEVGFEDFAHFSRSFKKMYGYNSSTLRHVPIS